MSDTPESETGQESDVPVQDEPEYTEVDEARKAHRRLFGLGLLALVLAIIAFFFPRCDFSDDEDFGVGTGLTDEQLLALIEENCIIPGETGPAGEQGEPGAPGSSGAEGPEGEQGEPGATGRPGSPGPTGATGPAGSTGATGPAGATGATGPQGEQGICGPIGPAGPQGEAGPAGAQGEPGPAGPQGIQGVQGPRGLTGATGPAGPQGVPGPVGFGDFGSFWDQCTQVNSLATGAVPMLFDFVGVADGVFIPGAGGDACSSPNVPIDDGGPTGSQGGSRISFTQPGIYNIQFSAQYTNLQGGTETLVEIWIRRNGINIPWSNTHFYTISNSPRSVAMINWFVEVECDTSCDYYEIMWDPTQPNQPTLPTLDTVLLADPLVSPAIPSIILTVNQVGNLVTPP